MSAKKIHLSPRRPGAPPAAASAAASSMNMKESRLSVNIPGVTHKGLKVLAAQQSITVRELVLNVLRAAGFDVPPAG